jgi:3-methyladenine DNA glycosylase AlkD
VTTDAELDAAVLGAALEARGEAGYAEGAKRYLKSDLDFYGTRMPLIRRTVRDFRKERPDLSRPALLRLVKESWSRPVHEMRLAAILLLAGDVDRLRATDLGVVENMLRTSFTWAYVDPLAIDVGGGMWVAGTLSVGDLDRWANDDDFWIRRSSMLVLLKPAKAGNEKDFERFARYADSMLEEKEFFIRKAIGWVLREVSKKDPEKVQAWVEPRLDQMSGVTRREAIKYLPTARPHRSSRR